MNLEEWKTAIKEAEVRGYFTDEDQWAAKHWHLCPTSSIDCRRHRHGEPVDVRLASLAREFVSEVVNDWPNFFVISRIMRDIENV